jgi:hypothetical protein
MFPGMVLHAVHNSILICLGLYESWFRDLTGWSSEDNAHLPAFILLAGTVGSVLGLVGIGLLPRPQEGPRIPEE